METGISWRQLVLKRGAWNEMAARKCEKFWREIKLEIFNQILSCTIICYSKKSILNILLNDAEEISRIPEKTEKTVLETV